jgi:hypothetical protein
MKYIEVAFRGVPLLKKQTFRLSGPNFRGRKLLLPNPDAIHCWITLDNEIQTLQNLARVTFVTDIIAEMFGRKNTQGALERLRKYLRKKLCEVKYILLIIINWVDTAANTTL